MTHTVTLQQSGKQFQVEAGETVLDAARRAGLALPYSCLGGSCGSCKATIVTGECSYPAHEACKLRPRGLSQLEQDQHEALLCQAVPSSDLLIAAREVASVANMPKRQFAVKVAAKDLLATDVMRLQLKTPQGQKLNRLAGQYLDVLVGDGKRRSFSIANAPEAGAFIELHIRHVQGGGFTQHVFEQLKVGDLLRIEGPLGTFVPREDSERPMIFVAGGTGFAPIKALIEHFVALRTLRPMHLYWGVRTDKDLYLADLPMQWQQSQRQFSYTTVFSDQEAMSDAKQSDANHGCAMHFGLVHEQVLSDFPALSNFDVYMSGPPTMIETSRRAFLSAGLPETQLFYDSFEYAPDVLAAILRQRAGLDF